MNISLIKEDIINNRGRKVKIIVRGLRNKTFFYEGIVQEAYNNIFTIVNNGEIKSFTYNDVITGEVNIDYL